MQKKKKNPVDKMLGESPKEIFFSSYMLTGNIDLIHPERKLSLTV